MDLIRMLADAGPVARIQRVCGVEYEKPMKYDQQTQTRQECPHSNNGPASEHTSIDNTKTVVDNSLPVGERCNGRVKDIDRSTVHDVDDNSDTVELPGMCSRERNNNGSVVTSSNKVSPADRENSKSPELHEKVTNSYRIIQPSNKVYRKTSPLEHRKNSADLGCSKDSSDDNVSTDADSTTPVTPVVIIKYKSLLYLARFGAFLGNELFYLTFFPFLIWNLDFLVVRQVSMLWCVVMYLGQATKDYLRWPRPRCPPVVRLEVHYTREYSMPSTHAMAGTAIPLYLAYLAVERYQVPVIVAGPLALMWFSVTCWSRLYLGVHSILDLLVGCVYALAIFFTFLGYVEGYDLYQQTHPFGAPVLLFTALTLCTVLYPTHHKNSSKADAVQIVSAYTGLGIGSWLGYQFGYMHESDISQPYLIAVPTLSWCFMALLRFITGLAVLAFLYGFTKWWSVRFYSYIYGLDEPDKKYPGVMTAYKFTTYAVVGAGAALFAPLVHLLLNIHRHSMFYEVL